ncbi:hypothetical protein [Pyxidicoccus xibeiensis]|uniref:hypothetical protein n=1 Tax=Pyxidicoccus xibeiensis TaxID=2906759 RepID=UPI0020A79725|nr:hypothetical protein [Pyxidicoccus xibeiensis]MCP3137184.1 hypothetical protein [Pyxidicoccus xibeiensis]
MRRPWFELEEVRRLAEEDRFELNQGPACAGALNVYVLAGFGHYRTFAQAVVLTLRLEDFWRTRRWPEPDGALADEYGLRLPRALLETYEVGVSTWYVKLSVLSGRRGEQLFFLSLHPLAFDMERNGGLLRPGH